MKIKILLIVKKQVGVISKKEEAVQAVILPKSIPRRNYQQLY